MSLRTLVALAVLVLVAGCATKKKVDACRGVPEPWLELPDGGCVTGAADASMDAAQDAGVDAGACGGECAGATPYCLESDGGAAECVQCRTSGDCAERWGDAGAPLDGGMVPLVCEETTHECVVCGGNADCRSAGASKCEAGGARCVGCETNADCAHVAGRGVCDEGMCVECTGSEREACAGKVCDARARECGTADPLSAGLCEECVSDAQCREGQVCVVMTYGAGMGEVGTFCLWEQAAMGMGAPDGACSRVRPYVRAETVTTLDGRMTTVCGLAVTTCPALNDFRGTSCSAPGADAECGAEGFDDGLCVMFDAAANRCTTTCGSDDDCKAGFTCDDTLIPNRCRL